MHSAWTVGTASVPARPAETTVGIGVASGPWPRTERLICNTHWPRIGSGRLRRDLLKLRLMPEFGIWIGVILAAGLAGWMDAIAGGGGLLTLPALLGCGLSPHLALGTNKLQAVLGSGTAAWQFHRSGWLPGRDWIRGFMVACTTGALGSAAVQAVEAGTLRRWIPLLLLGAALVVAVRPRFGALPRQPVRKPNGVEPVAAALLGFYDGFFGPGTGTFWTVTLVTWGGLELTAATARTKVMNLASNLGALVMFAMGGAVHWPLGLAMGLAQATGARLGARMAAARGRRLIRPVFLAVVTALILRLAWDMWRDNPQP